MNTKIDELMTHNVITARPHHTIDHVRRMLDRNGISAIVIVGTEHEPLGIVTSRDLVSAGPAGAPISKAMSSPCHCVPQYNNVEVAARIMRKHRIHHVVVTHEHRVVGIISSYDLLELVEERRFTSKAPPTSRRARAHT